MFPGEGTPADYVVSSLHSHDFVYNLFQEQQAPAPEQQQQQEQQPEAVIATSR